MGSNPSSRTTLIDDPDLDYLPRVTKANYVYFVQAKALGLIKIGIARCYNSRVSSLQVGSPDPLQLLGILRPASDPKWVEQRLHTAFRHLREHGEWFRPGEDLLAFIRANAIGEDQNDWEVSQIVVSKLRGEPIKPWTDEIAAYYEECRKIAAQPRQDHCGQGRPVIPLGVEAPKGGSRKARMERYLLARGLSA